MLVLALARPALAQVPACGVAGFGSQTFEIDGDPFCDNSTSDGLTDWCPADPDHPASACQPVFDGAITNIQGVRAWARDGNFGVPNTETSIFDGGSNKNNDLIGAGQDPWTEKSGGGFPQKNDITDATIYTFIDDLGDRWIVFSMATRSTNGASHADIEFNLAGITPVPAPSGGGADSLLVGNGPNGGRTPIDPITSRPRDFILSTDFATGGTVDRSDFFVWQNVGGTYQYAAPPTGSVNASDVLICTNNPTSQPPDGHIPAPCWGAIGQDGLPATSLLDQQWEEFAINLGAFGFNDTLLCGANSTVTFKTRSSPSFTAELKDLLIVPFSIVAPPVCSLDGETAVCAGSTAHITSSVSGGSACQYNWSILSGDGSFQTGGGQADNFADVVVSGTDTVKVQLTVNCSGCESEPCTWSIFPKPNPTCSISGPDPVCDGSTGNTYTATVSPAGGSVTYSWSITGNGSIVGAIDGASISVTASGAGSYTVRADVTRDGCPGFCTKTVTVNANPTCSISGPDPVCDGSTGNTYTSSVSPAGGTVVYSWSITGNGSIVGATNGASISVTASGAGSFTVRLDVTRNGCPGFCTKTVTVNANPTCSLDGNLEPCTGQDETYTSVVSPSGGTVTYSWTVVPADCGTIVGSDADASVVVNWAHTGPCTLHLAVTRDGCPGECELVINPKNCNAEFCTVTQGYWGNAGGQKCYNGQQMGTLEILQALITPNDPLVVGKKGVGLKSLTILDGQEQCIIDLLPGGGPSAQLPDGFGDQTLNSNCTTNVPLPTFPRNGRIRNVLLTQTITLALNLRFDGGDLANVGLCPYMTTVDANPGPDGCLGNDDDSPDVGGFLTFQIPQSVLDYLGQNATVANLLDLANCALAGVPNLPSLVDIEAAVDAINEGFDECRFLQLCGPTAPFSQPTTPVDQTRNQFNQTGAGFGEGVPVKFGLFGALPNPTHATSMVRFALPEASQVHLVLYNLRGQEVKVLVNGVMDQGYKSVGLQMQGLPSGIYFYRLDAAGLDSGTHFRETQKVLLIQ